MRGQGETPAQVGNASRRKVWRALEQCIGERQILVGYDSEAAFNRAFKREFGMPPAAWRKSEGGSKGLDSTRS